METYSGTLVLAGILAGLVSFFSNYVNLPFSKPSSLFDETQSSLKDNVWVALAGYIVVGLAGAFLTPLIDAVTGGLKGLAKPYDSLVLFGYGVVFGYSTTRILVSVLDSVLKKITSLESKVGNIVAVHENLYQKKASSQEIIDACESSFEQYKDDCSGFVKAVAAQFSVNLSGLANDIVNQIQQPEWTLLGQDGTVAKTKAEEGWLVVGGLSGQENVPAQDHGHVVVVVAGALNSGKYPNAYWGKLCDEGAKATTINWAWNKESRDKVIYAAKKI